MRRSRGVVLLLILAAVVGMSVVIKLTTSAAQEPAQDVRLAGPGAAATLDPTTPTPGRATYIPSPPIEPPAGTQAVFIAAAGTVTAVPAQDLQVLVPTGTPLLDSTSVRGWNPPAISVPVAHSPWDHYWFIRPVAAKYTNFGLPDYPYGSNGEQNDLRIHHGIDLANPIGIEVLAAGDGTVDSAQKGHFNEYESITSYGNCIVIDHDFGYNGQHIYTLYAHLSAILVTKGQHVHTGQVIGLIGNTGQVTGPHVHFEVRVGRDSYFSVRNPVLWMAPYVGTGVVAGRVAFPGGALVDDAVVTLINQANGSVVTKTPTYAGFGVPSDDNWKENFVFPDVPVGSYLVTSTYDTTTWAGTVDVVPGATNWVDLKPYSSYTLPLAPPPTP